MVQLVEAIAKSLVDHPEAVEVKEVEGRTATVIELRVAPEDMGKVIGKQGRIAKAIRVVVKAAATKANKKVAVEIVQ
ncbi:MAG: KH domain-containing protein [Eubacteriales bacterium]|nr:KH domain-containing protein [Eubacteriales bacterium]MDD3350169.1 KH domain-containing protein [Eubacteriales bacterium]